MKIDVVELQLKKTGVIDIAGGEDRIYGVRSAGPIFCDAIGSCNVEHVAMLSLDSVNKPINYFTVSVGGIDSVKVSLAQLFRAALLSNAAKIIVAHNHPSGVLSITPKDIDMTKKIGFWTKHFDIILIDSLIVSGDKALSIREHCKELSE